MTHLNPDELARIREEYGLALDYGYSAISQWASRYALRLLDSNLRLEALLAHCQKRSELWIDCTCDDSGQCHRCREWNVELDKIVAICTGEPVNWAPS